MCGIAGILDRTLESRPEDLRGCARRMGDALLHRGPDGGDVFIDERAGLAMAHRRLAIVDLTPSGAQPMTSSDGRFVICYNGEVYNAEDLRAEPDLAGVSWRGHSDTEVILELVARRGLSETLPLLNGMFAIALWDRKARVLQLARDRLGIKPLFYQVDGQRCVFGSELKALLALPGQRQRCAIDPASVASFLRFAYVPAPHTIFRGVEKLMPGQMLRIQIGSDGMAPPERLTYWSLATAAQMGVLSELDLPDAQIIAQATALLGDAVARQMMGDVPLGAFLSGGIDSSTVVALMVAAKQGPVRTFSIGFDERGFDEAPYAAAVARHLGTSHTELRVTGTDALALIPTLPQCYDEPFADSSQIPTMLVSKLTREHVTVALSGDGGDELFAGYNRYKVVEKLSQRLNAVPMSIRRGASAALRALPVSFANGIGNALPRAIRVPLAGDKMQKFATALPLDEEGIYRFLVSQMLDPATLVPSAREHDGLRWSGPEAGPLPTTLDKLQFLDAATYLPDDILQKVDRASMAFSLEARPPLLDHRVVEFAWRLPHRFKIRNGETKWVLRRVLDQFVPRSLVERPKMGFGIPLAQWLRGPLRDWAEDLLDPRVFGGGIVDPKAAQALWREHLANRNHAYGLWAILMFEAWRRQWQAM